MTLYQLLAFPILVDYFQLLEPFPSCHCFVELASLLTDLAMLIKDLEEVISDEVLDVVLL